MKPDGDMQQQAQEPKIIVLPAEEKNPWVSGPAIGGYCTVIAATIGAFVAWRTWKHRRQEKRKAKQ